MALFNADNRSNRIDNRISHSKSFGVYARGATVNVGWILFMEKVNKIGSFLDDRVETFRVRRLRRAKRSPT